MIKQRTIVLSAIIALAICPQRTGAHGQTGTRSHFVADSAPNQEPARTPPTVSVAEATIADIPALIALDSAISFEFFEPLYATAYSQYDFGKHPHEYLARELVSDQALFEKVIGVSGTETKVAIARSIAENHLAGFIVVSRSSEHEAEIDLLLVAKEYRNKHIGKLLIQALPALWPDVTTYDVYPFRFANDATLAFYEHMGFKRLGPAPAERINAYGVSIEKLQFHYQFVAPISPSTTRFSWSSNHCLRSIPPS